VREGRASGPRSRPLRRVWLVVRVTVWVGPDPATFTAVLALLPRFTLALAGLREMLKDCAGKAGDADASFDPAEVPPALVGLPHGLWVGSGSGSDSRPGPASGWAACPARRTVVPGVQSGHARRRLGSGEP